jgi:catechol 2,3-dioxygenase-like lactoylglutathione lyase family enzyme
MVTTPAVAHKGQIGAGGRSPVARTGCGGHTGDPSRRLTVFLSLDFVYVPTADVDAAAERYVAVLGARLEWKVRGMGTVVACLRVADAGPAILLSGHLEGENPVLVYRVADYRAAVTTLWDGGLGPVAELEIPHGPCASFRAPGGQRFAVYELVRPGAAEYFTGRIDE